MRAYGRVGAFFPALALATQAVVAQVPLAFSDAVKPVSSMDSQLRAALQAKAGSYPLVGYAFFGRDSVLLVFEDSAMTGAALNAHTWMFGPAVTAAEADSCPPEKVLGRKIARVLFRFLDRPAAMQQIVVAVHGTNGKDRWTVEDMYYYREQLEGRWAGDLIPK